MICLIYNKYDIQTLFISIFYYDGLHTNHHNNQFGTSETMFSIFYYDGLHTNHHNNQFGTSETMFSIFYYDGSGQVKRCFQFFNKRKHL
jgi:hypothetical protein